LVRASLRAGEGKVLVEKVATYDGWSLVLPEGWSETRHGKFLERSMAGYHPAGEEALPSMYVGSEDSNDPDVGTYADAQLKDERGVKRIESKEYTLNGQKGLRIVFEAQHYAYANDRKVPLMIRHVMYLVKVPDQKKFIYIIWSNYLDKGDVLDAQGDKVASTLTFK